jgi:hypothetical protein
MRAAAVAFLTDYKNDVGVKMQVYPGRPRSIAPPTGFVDLIRERISYTGLNQRQPQADVIVIHGLFDSQEAADQKDAFIDGFIDWSLDRLHQANANTLCAVVETTDIPDYVPDWMPPDQQKTYYASRIVLEGLALTG